MYLGNNAVVNFFQLRKTYNFILDFVLLRKNDLHTNSSHLNNIMLMGPTLANSKNGLNSQWLPSNVPTQQYPVAHSMVIYLD